VVETDGVRYELLTPPSTYYRLPAAGAAVVLAVRRLIRDGAVTLDGSATLAEKQAFDLLTLVQHVGPKLAFPVLSLISPEELAAAIMRGDIDPSTRARARSLRSIANCMFIPSVSEPARNRRELLASYVERLVLIVIIRQGARRNFPKNQPVPRARMITRWAGLSDASKGSTSRRSEKIDGGEAA